MKAISKRSIAAAIVFSFITFGIYLIYWYYQLVKNVRAITNNDSSCTGEMLCLILVPFYSLYWWYTRGEQTKKEFDALQHHATGSGVVYLILSIFGLSIVSMAIMQNDFNSLPTEPQSNQ